MHISQLELWSIVEKDTEFKKNCNLHQVRFQVNVFFLSDDNTHLNQFGLYLFGHVARASPEDDCWRAFLAAISKPRADGNDEKNALEQPGPGVCRTILHN